MEYLINKLEQFAITKDVITFNNNVNLLNKLTITELDPDHEWEMLKKNYSNLRYISQLIEHYHYQLNTNFYQLLSKFIDPIDKSTQHYIQNINWENNEDDISSLEIIKENFDKSLNTSNVTDKIKYILLSYDVLIPIIEDIRLEKYYEKVDEELQLDFNPKRLKLL